MKEKRTSVAAQVMSESSRYARWNQRDYMVPSYTFASDDEASEEENKLVDLLQAARLRHYQERDIPLPHVTISDWITLCKEVIYDVVDGCPVFHCIAYTFNVGRCEVEVGPLFDIPVSNETPEEIEDGVRTILAYAFFAEVPVYPNTEALVGELGRYHRDLTVDGFTAPDSSGVGVRLVPAKSPGRKVQQLDYLSQLRISEPRHPAELALLQEACGLNWTD